MARLLALDEAGYTPLQSTIVFPIHDCPKYIQNYSPGGVVWSVVTVCRPRRSDIKCVGDGWFGKSPSEREPPEPLRGASPLAVTCGAARTQGDGVMRKAYMYINTA